MSKVAAATLAIAMAFILARLFFESRPYRVAREPGRVIYIQPMCADVASEDLRWTPGCLHERPVLLQPLPTG